MQCLVDTSVWVDHFRSGVAGLDRLLVRHRVICHAAILGELACGPLMKRPRTMTLLRLLPQLPARADVEVLDTLEQHRLFGRGIGWVDVHLLAAVLAQPCVLWTRDRRLQRAASDLQI